MWNQASESCLLICPAKLPLGSHQDFLKAHETAIVLSNNSKIFVSMHAQILHQKTEEKHIHCWTEDNFWEVHFVLSSGMGVCFSPSLPNEHGSFVHGCYSIHCVSKMTQPSLCSPQDLPLQTSSVFICVAHKGVMDAWGFTVSMISSPPNTLLLLCQCSLMAPVESVLLAA